MSPVLIRSCFFLSATLLDAKSPRDVEGSGGATKLTKLPHPFCINRDITVPLVVINIVVVIYLIVLG